MTGYRNIVTKRATLYLTDTLHFSCQQDTQVRIPTPLASRRTVHLDLIAYIYTLGGDDELGYVFCDWIKKFLQQLSFLSSLSLRVNTEGGHVNPVGLEDLQETLTRGGWMKLPHSEDLRVYGVRDIWNFDDEEWLCLRLSEDKGKMEVVAAAPSSENSEDSGNG